MKKNVLTKSLSLLFFTFLLVSCETNDEAAAPIKENPQQTLNCENANGYIKKEEALKMEALYVQNQYRVINKNITDDPNYRDNRVVSFTIEEIECFFDNAKKKASAKGYDASKMRFKIYFGAKPEQSGTPKSTVFLVTTVNDSIKNFAADSNFDEGGYYNYGNAGDGEG